MERKWRRTGLRADLEQLKAIRCKYTHELNESKSQHINKLIIDCEHDPKKLFQLVSNLTGSKVENPLPEGHTNKDLADSFADFFIGKIEKIRNELAQYPKYVPIESDSDEFSDFVPLNEVDIRKIITKSKSTGCELDPLPTSLLKENIDILVPVITKIVNMSLCDGIFSTEWKTAIVRPLLKKVGLELIESNYRPVSNLSFLSKITEKAALVQLDHHLEKNDLKIDYQSAYKSDYSTETALLRVINDILLAMDNQNIMVLCAIDLSAAFDTVDHDILLSVLGKVCRISGKALNWFDTYLRPRNMKVCINSEYSCKKDLTFSVPQGSCAGPVLYNIYAGTLAHEMENSPCRILGYADDHCIFKSFKAGQVPDQENAIKEMENCLDSIRQWMKHNRLKMNDTKTEVIYFGNQVQLDKCNLSSLKVGTSEVDASQTIKYLGVTLDTNMTFTKHIKAKCKIASYNLYRIRKIRKYLTEDSCRVLIQALVISHLDYSNGVFINLSKKAVEPMQKIQNMAAKIVLKKLKYDSSKESLKELHWLPIEFRIKFKIVMIVFKCINGNAPKYLKELNRMHILCARK